MRFDGRTVVITGAGSGIGRAMAEGFHQEGASVIAVDIDSDAAHGTVDALNQAAAGRARALRADVSDREDVRRLADAVLGGDGVVDVLCNNAGVFDDFTPTHDTPEGLWDRVIDINLKGPFLVSAAFLPSMIERRSGAIINTASIAGVVGGTGGAAYTASKHGLVGLTRQLAFDYGKYGIRANAICPGCIATEMTVKSRGGANPHIERGVPLTPAGRWGTPEEVARLAMFLASDEASFIHGAPMMVDGGWTVP